MKIVMNCRIFYMKILPDGHEYQSILSIDLYCIDYLFIMLDHINLAENL